jgi:hypothetical protein
MARKLDNKGDTGAYEISAKATAAITANPTAGLFPGGLFVELDTDPNYFKICGAGHEPIGIVDSNVAAGAESMIKAGVRLCLIKLGDTVAALAYVQSDAAGKAVTATFTAPIGGQVLEGGVVDDVVPLMFGKLPTIAGAPVGTVGANVASATALPAVTGTYFHVTGTTTVTSMTTTGAVAGQIYTLRFDDILTFTKGNNMKLASTMTTSADDTISLLFDGTNFIEVARSVN